jgi:L-lactate dehydrogenase complex protein LldE
MLRVGDRPRRLLEAVRGLTLVDLPGAEECCGFGGTFAVKNADTSVAMGADKARHVRETGAEVLVAGDNSCLTHIGGVLSRQRSGVRVMHLAEVLASTDPTAGPGETAGSRR